MGDARDSRTPVVCDTCVLVNFVRVERVDLLERHARFRFVVPEQVLDEVAHSRQRASIDAAVARGGLEVVVSIDLAEIKAAAELRLILGRGEAVAIAVAQARGWCIATDELRRTRRAIVQRLGEQRLLTTPGILLASIRAGQLTVDEADRIKQRLEALRFRMSFDSFGELLP